MKRIVVTVLAFMPIIGFAQDENEIIKVSQLRAKFDCLEQVTVFPNPTRDNRVVISTPRGARCEIFNLSGVLIDSKETTLDEAEFTSLNQGTYIAVIHIDNMITQQKFVVL